MTSSKTRRSSRKSNGPDSTAATEDRIAQRFAEENEGAFCYVRDWRCWAKWNGTTWKRDAKDTVVEAIRRLCRTIAENEPEPRKAERLGSFQKIKAIEQLARSDQQLAIDADRWDRDLWILNTPEGIVDLRTGKTSSSDPLQYLMKQTTASPQGSCPRWMEFLRVVTEGDTELMEYLQRVTGYCLTGDVSEQVFFYLWGTGANGKSVFTKVLVEILGTYAGSAPPGMLKATHQDRHPTEIAALKGLRLVTAPEMEKTAALALNKLKLLTGGDRLSARKMNQDFSEFNPTFKLFLVGNALPQVPDVDEAIRRRLRIIPFTVTIAPDQRDPGLVGKLLDEADGILAWAIQGCLDWQKHGLDVPDRLSNFTEDHLDDADPFTRFVEECCEANVNFSVGSSDLYKAFCRWAKAADSDPMSQKTLVQRLAASGYRRRRGAGKRFISGLRLRTSEGGVR